MVGQTGRKARKGPAAPKKKVDTAYALIRRKIIRCEFAPGADLIEKDLIADLGLGRTPVREALVRLIYDGLIEVAPRVGYRVTELTEDSIRDLFFVWRKIAPVIVREAGKRMSEKQRNSVGAKTARFSRLSASLSPEKLHREIANIYDDLSTQCGSKHLRHIYTRLQNELERVYTLYLSTPEGREWASTLDPKRMVQALTPPDPKRDSPEKVDNALEDILNALRMRRSRGFS